MMFSNVQVKSQVNPEAWRMQPIDIVRLILIPEPKRCSHVGILRARAQHQSDKSITNL
jgi:hypothetical protein